MPGKEERIEALSATSNRKASWQEVKDHLWEDDPVATPISQPVDTLISMQKKSEKAKEEQSAGVLATLWNWMTTPFSFGAPPVVQSGPISAGPAAIKPASSPLEPPSQIDTAQLNQFVTEMKLMLKQITEVMNGSAEELLEQYYKDQSLLYKIGVRTTEAEFVRKQRENGGIKGEVQKARDDVVDMHANANWWGAANQLLKVATAVATIAGAVFFFVSTYGAGLPAATMTMINGTLTLASTAVGIVGGITGIMKSHLDRQVNALRGEGVLLRLRQSMTQLKLRDCLDRMDLDFKAFLKVYEMMKQLGDRFLQTGQVIFDTNQ